MARGVLLLAALPPAAALGNGTGRRIGACHSAMEVVFARGTVLPSAGRWEEESDAQRAAVAASVAAAARGETAEAAEHAARAGYDLCEDPDDRELLLWVPPHPGPAKVAARVADPAATPVVLEVNHPIFDSSTLEQGLRVLRGSRARALVLSGAHRCSATRYSGCDGTTSVCGHSAPYLESDSAHNERLVFQAAHEALAAAYGDHLFISLHGMAADGVSLSHQVPQQTTADSPLATLRGALAARFPSLAHVITTCQSYTGANVRNHLCGGTNTQGRHLNGSPLPCTVASRSASCRFIHMEQERSLREGAAAGDLIAEAIRSSFGGGVTLSCGEFTARDALLRWNESADSSELD